MKLFDDEVHKYKGLALYAEPAFTYLNRSARPPAENMRRTLEAWFSQYPRSEQAGLRARLRSKDDGNHCSAFFELLLHQLLLRMGCRVQIHPDLPDRESTRHPDFLVESTQGARFYAEAVIATGVSARERAARARMDDVYDAINRLHSPNFFVALDIIGAPDTPPPARHIRALLKERLGRLDPGEVEVLWRSGGIQAVPHWQYEHEGWKIDFHPIPKSASLRGKPDVRPIGMRSFEMKFVDASSPIRDAIVGKAGRYGELDLPYVIAVNSLDDNSVDRIDMMDALFGKETYVLAIGRSGAMGQPEMTREPNGVWTSRSGPTYTRVSAVLLAISVMPWTIGRAGVFLIHNPWAQRPYDSELTRLPQGVPREGLMHWEVGLSLGEALRLAPGWPFV
jgi:hypothetical protein